MKLSKLTLNVIAALAVGVIFGWVLRPIIEGDPSVPLPEYGGTVDCGFNAEVSWHPETKVEGKNLVLHDTTWKWVFHNRSDEPIQLSIPEQQLQLVRGTSSRQFIELPESMLVDPPITIEPDGKREYTASRGRLSSQKVENAEYGFLIVAKVDDRFHILGCAANVREAPKAEPAGSGQPM